MRVCEIVVVILTVNIIMFTLVSVTGVHVTSFTDVDNICGFYK